MLPLLCEIWMELQKSPQNYLITLCKYLKLSNTDTSKLHKESDSAQVNFSTQVTHTCLTAQAES